MKIELKYQPSYSLGIVSLDPGETLQVEGGSMVSMSSDISIQTQARGGLLKSLGRSLLGGALPRIASMYDAKTHLEPSCLSKTSSGTWTPLAMNLSMK